MDANDYKMIMHFFPPVNNTIENPYMEAVQSYNMYKAISPLKPPDKDLMYSEQIINDLRTLRILLHSNLPPERFLYEINKMYEAWGPQGPQGPIGRNILNKQFIDLFNNIKHKEEKLQELMKEGSSVATDYELGQLEQQLGDFTFKHKYNSRDFKDLDLGKLNLNSSGSKSSKAISKKRVVSKRKGK